ncbi:MAG: DUF6132 family protein [Vicingaceae bacterium]|nr:DUF6132 family protein [Vicingaceae bacterium]
MKYWLSKNKTPLLISVLGAIVGYSYWYFVGCASGTCAITSVWWRSTIYGVIMGWLLGSLINEKVNKKIKQNED